MKSFRAFLREQRLSEMPHLLSWLAMHKQSGHIEGNPFTKNTQSTKLGDYNHEYEVHHDVSPPEDEYNPEGEHAYKLIHKPTGDTHVNIEGYHATHGNDFHVKYVESSEDSKVKAHDFYHHLVTNHGLKIRSDTGQSEGGAKLWHKLSQKPDVSVTHHDMYGNQIPLHQNWSDNYSKEREPQNIHTYSHFIARKK